MAIRTFLKSPGFKNLDKQVQANPGDGTIGSNRGYSKETFIQNSHLNNPNGEFAAEYQQDFIDDTSRTQESINVFADNSQIQINNQKSTNFLNDTQYTNKTRAVYNHPSRISPPTSNRLNSGNLNFKHNESNRINNVNQTLDPSNYSSNNISANLSNSHLNLPKLQIPKSSISNTSIATAETNYSTISNYDVPPYLVNTNSSNSDSLDIDSPPLTPNMVNESRSIGSPDRRVLSEKIIASPSNLHRLTRNYSASFVQNDGPIKDTSVSNSMILQTKLINENLPPELSPIVNLINCQKLRSYAIGVFNIAGKLKNEKVWIEVEAKLTGNELAIWRPSTIVTGYELEENYDEFKPKYINLIDTKIKITNLKLNEITILHDYKTDSTISIKFNCNSDLVKWFSAIQLSKYEYISLNEAYTAVLLSIKGSKLSDIHVLLAPKKRFVKQEWINLRLPQITNRWLKLYMIITPSDSKSYGKIEFYKDNKKINEKNLIAYVSTLTSIFNVFPEQMNMIDFNSIMKLQGEIYINKNFEYIFHSDDSNFSLPDRSEPMKGVPASESSTSIFSVLSPPTFKKGHSRTNSDNLETSTSFFTNAPGAKLSPPSSPLPKSSSKFRLRSFSLGNNSTEDEPRSRSTSFAAKNLDQFVGAGYMYIMPLTHPGVPAIETMIRNLIYIIDAFKLYGRPRHLISDKMNPDSFLFGLPSLPHFEYFSDEEARRIIEGNLRISPDANSIDWRSVLKTHLVPKRQSGYKGSGDITRLYSSLDFSLYDPMENTISSPQVKFPRIPSPEDGSFTDLSADNDLNYNNQMSNTYSNSNLSGNLSNNLLGAPIDIKRKYNSSPLSNSFSTESALST